MRSILPGLALLFVSACGVETIVAAEPRMVLVDAAVDGGRLDCERASDCQSDEYCSKNGCGAQRGTCTLRPASCTAEEMPVCGCDGVSYFNDCLRRQNGMDKAAERECDQQPERCGGPSDDPCPEGSVCALILRGRPPPICPNAPPGVCWVIPTTCDAEARRGGDRFTPCGAPPACLDLCTAIRAHVPMLRLQQQCDP